MSDVFFIRVRGKIRGPFDLPKMQSLVQRGQIGQQHEVSLDGIEWQAASQFPEVFTGSDNQIYDSFERPTPDYHSTKRTTQQKAIDEEPTFTPEPKPRVESTSSLDWFYTHHGESKGPITLNRLRAEVKAGRLKRNQLVWNSSLPEWSQVGSLPQFQDIEDSFSEERSQVFSRNSTHPLTLARIIPLGRWVSDQSWSLKWVQYLFFAFLFPFALLTFCSFSELSLLAAAGAFSMYFAILWAAFLHRCMNPEPIGTARVVGTWFFTSVFMIFIVLLFTLVMSSVFSVGLLFLGHEIQQGFLKTWAYMTLCVGLVEEFTKLIPVLWLSSRLDSVRPTTIAYLGAISGLAFGATEAISYSFLYAMQLFESGGVDDELVGTYLMIQLLRLISLPLLHAIWSAITGYFVGISRKLFKGRKRVVIYGLIISSVLHGTYNALSATQDLQPASLLVVIVSFLLFVGYLRQEDSILRELSHD